MLDESCAEVWAEFSRYPRLTVVSSVGSREMSMIGAASSSCNVGQFDTLSQKLSGAARVEACTGLRVRSKSVKGTVDGG